MPAPVLVFGYNRLDHFKNCITALKNCELAAETDLFVFIDGYKNSELSTTNNLLRGFASGITGFKSVTTKFESINKGLAASIINGVSGVIAKYEKVIVVEDDLVCTPDTLVYMNQALDFYQNNESVYSVTAFNYPISMPDNFHHQMYFATRSSSYFWGTWSHKWNTTDWCLENFKKLRSDKKFIAAFNRWGTDMFPMLFKQQIGVISSWAVRWNYHHFRNNACCAYPVKSKVSNHGGDGTGSNTGITRKFESEMVTGAVSFTANVHINPLIEVEYRKYFNISTLRKIINFVKFRILFVIIEKL